MSDVALNLKNYLNLLPIQSFTDMTLGWMQNKDLLKNPTISAYSSGINAEAGLKTLMMGVRATCAHFFYPQASKTFALGNLSVGVMHLGIGVFELRQTKEKESSEELKPNWNEIALHIHKGFAHLITANYDFWIGYALSKKSYGLIGVAAFALLPSFVASLNKRIFSKPVEDPSSKIEKELEQDLEVDNSESDATPSTSDGTKTEYLDVNCATYQLAKKATLVVMMAAAQNGEGLAAKTSKIVRFMIGQLDEKAVPQYGL